ncbi:MAG TPA: hypothetical protein VK879_08210 [Candidatus Sulfomarinibacteraceae bacterium]|nr:hypothetical protein [Candidatus Sulfomarinibacteraceae bacterium]
MELPITVEDLRTLGLAVAIWIGVCVTLALVFVLLIVHRLRRLNVPPGAGFGETLLYTPLLLVLAVDLLDLGLDVLAAPITWVLLDRIGLKALRNVSAVEALIPFTGPIPTLTAAWVWVRLFGPHLGPLQQGEKRRGR